MDASHCLLKIYRDTFWKKHRLNKHSADTRAVMASADPRLPWSQICVCAFESCLLRADGCIAQAVAAVGKTPIFWTDLLDARIRVFDEGLAQD